MYVYIYIYGAPQHAKELLCLFVLCLCSLGA